MTTLAGRLMNIHGQALHGVKFNVVIDKPRHGVLTWLGSAGYRSNVGVVTTGTDGTFSMSVSQITGNALPFVPDGASYLIWGPYGMRSRFKANTVNTTTWDGVNRASAAYSSPSLCTFSLLSFRADTNNTTDTNAVVHVWLDSPDMQGGYLSDGTYVAGGRMQVVAPLGLFSLPLIQSAAYAQPANPWYILQFQDGERIRFQAPASSSATLLSTTYRAPRSSSG